jgi:chromosome segregation ATPase
MREADKVAELEKDMDSAEGIFEQIMGLFGVLRKRLTKKAEELPEDEKPEEEPENKPDKCQEDLEMKEINVALGLPEEAKLEEAVAKVKELQTPAEPKEFTDLKAEFASLQTKLTQAQDELKSERRKAKVAHYTEMARGWTNISGKPEDMAEQIVKVEEVDEAAGKILVEHFQHANEAAKVVTQPIGTPAEGDKPALTTFEKLVEDNLKDYNGALARERCFADTVRKYPDEYKEFRKQHPAK